MRATLIAFIILLILTSVARSQGHGQNAKVIIIEPYHLAITLNKTTNLIFPFAIKSIDIGSPDVLAQKAASVENVLYLKAALANFSQTNVSVITADGRLYSFVVDYATNPSVINISFVCDSISTSSNLVRLPGNNEAEMQSFTKQLVSKKRILHGCAVNANKIVFQLNGIYVNNNVMYLALQLTNKSYLNYDIQMLRFFIRDERKVKRTATQEIELQPLFVEGDTSVVRGKSENVMVFALQRFTIPDKKYLFIQLMEKNGGRHLNLRISNRVIVNARIIKPV